MFIILANLPKDVFLPPILTFFTAPKMSHLYKERRSYWKYHFLNTRRNSYLHRNTHMLWLTHSFPGRNSILLGTYGYKQIEIDFLSVFNVKRWSKYLLSRVGPADEAKLLKSIGQVFLLKMSLASSIFFSLWFSGWISPSQWNIYFLYMLITSNR